MAGVSFVDHLRSSHAMIHPSFFSYIHIMYWLGIDIKRKATLLRLDMIATECNSSSNASTNSRLWEAADLEVQPFLAVGQPRRQAQLSKPIFVRTRIRIEHQRPCVYSSSRSTNLTTEKVVSTPVVWSGNIICPIDLCPLIPHGLSVALSSEICTSI